MSARRFAIGTASTQALGERAAVDDIIEQLPEGAAGCTVLFCSTRYDLGQLGRALQAAGRTQVVGAATGRAIGGGRFLADGITGFHLPAGRFKIAKTLIEDAASFRLPDARELVRSLRGRLENGENSRLPHQFGILLVDAEVRCEERLIAALGTELGGVPIAGGSAGDIYFNPSGHAPGSTRMLYGRRGLSGAAVFCLVSCDSQVVALSHTHYIPGDRKLVITDADPER